MPMKPPFPISMSPPSLIIPYRAGRALRTAEMQCTGDRVPKRQNAEG